MNSENTKLLTHIDSSSIFQTKQTWKNMEKLKENAMNLNFQLQQGKKKFNYLVDHIPYQICKTIASISLKA